MFNIIGNGVRSCNTLVIDSSGTGRFWNFEGAKIGEKRKSKEAYDCKPPKTVFMDKEEVESSLPFLMK